MLNTIYRSITFLGAQATKGIAGMTLHSDSLNLPHATTADLPTKLEALNTANGIHKEAITEMTERRRALVKAVIAGRRFMMVAIANLKPRLGIKYSQAWDAAGLEGNLQVPRAADALLNTLQLMHGYLVAHPIVDGGLGLSAARVGMLHDDLANAITAVTLQKEVLDQALTTRNQNARALERAVRTLLRELHEVLPPLDSRWFAFGFKKPGAKAVPTVPENVVATLVGSNRASVKWTASARAEYYRILIKVLGVHADYVPMGSPADLDFMIEGLPGNAVVEVLVSAVNEGGESQRSAVVLVQTL